MQLEIETLITETLITMSQSQSQCQDIYEGLLIEVESPSMVPLPNEDLEAESPAMVSSSSTSMPSSSRSSVYHNTQWFTSRPISSACGACEPELSAIAAAAEFPQPAAPVAVYLGPLDSSDETDSDTDVGRFTSLAYVSDKLKKERKKVRTLKAENKSLKVKVRKLKAMLRKNIL